MIKIERQVNGVDSYIHVKKGFRGYYYYTAFASATPLPVSSIGREKGLTKAICSGFNRLSLLTHK